MPDGDDLKLIDGELQMIDDQISTERFDREHRGRRDSDRP
jgi:hypothetical protein